MRYQIVFVCPHGAAKSVLAAAYCQQLAGTHGIALRVISAGTEPDMEIAPPVVKLLRAEGIQVPGQRPRRVTRADLVTAHHIISLGCDLSDVAPVGSVIDYWNDVPSPSQDLHAARDKIVTHVEQLISTLAQR